MHTHSIFKAKNGIHTQTISTVTLVCCAHTFTDPYNTHTHTQIYTSAGAERAGRSQQLVLAVNSSAGSMESGGCVSAGPASQSTPRSPVPALPLIPIKMLSRCLAWERQAPFSAAIFICMLLTVGPSVWNSHFANWDAGPLPDSTVAIYSHVAAKASECLNVESMLSCTSFEKLWWMVCQNGRDTICARVAGCTPALFCLIGTSSSLVNGFLHIRLDALH